MRRRSFIRGTAAFAGGAAFVGPAAAGQGNGSGQGNEDLRIESFDGVELAATLYTPDGDGPFPSVLMTHGYGSRRNSPTVTREAERYEDAGYVVLTYDSRGFNNSGGVSGFNGPKEVGDALTLVEWLGNRPDVETTADGSPRVGMDGLSYAGGIQQNTAAARPQLVDELGLDLSFDLTDGGPLDAIVPRMTWNDLRFAIAPNGVIKRSWIVGVLGAGTAATHHTTTGNLGAVQNGQDRRLYEWVAEGLATNEIPAEAEDYLARRSPMATRPEDVDVPVLLLQGWPDTLVTPIEAVRSFHALQADDTSSRLVLYPGGHSESELVVGLDDSVRAKLDEVSLAWLDYHVHPDRSPSLPEPVTMHTDRPTQNGGSQWRTADAFPPNETTHETVSLASAGRTDSTPLANTVAPGSTRGPTGTLLGSPGEDAPGQSASFDFVATEPMEAVGTPTVDLAVEPVSDDALGNEAHLFVKLERVANGRATVVDEQVTPFSVTGSGVQQVTGPLQPLQQYLDADERLRVTLSTTENGFTSSREAAGVVVHHAGDESTLTVPAVTTDDGLLGTTEPL